MKAVRHALIVLLCIHGLCFVAPARAAGEDAARPAIETLLRSWRTAFEARNLHALMAHYERDAVFAPAGRRTAVGISGLRRHYAPYFAVTRPRLILDIEDVAVRGTMASVLTRIQLEQQRGTEAAAAETGRQLWVLVRGEDGRWRIRAVMDNPSAPDERPHP